MADEPNETPPEPTPGDGAPPEGTEDKTIPQSEVDRIIADRLARERKKYADYDDLRSKAEQYDQLKREQESEVERAVREARETAEQEVTSRFQQERLADRIRVAAAKRLNDPEDAVRLIDPDGLDPADTDAITARIEQLVESKPYLAVSEPDPAAQRSGSADATSRSTGSATGNHVSVGAAIKALRGT